MHALIVHCHPEPRSFNAALRDIARESLQRQGWSVDVSDLYAEGFDPVEGPARYADRADPELFAPLVEQRHAWTSGTLPADVAREVERLERAELLLLQFPFWWHGLPAMLKGWFDRVFVSGGLYTSTMRYDRGHFRGRRALCSITSGAPAEVFGPHSRGGDLERMLYPIQYSLYYMGYSVLPAFHADGIPGHGYGAGDDARLQRHRNDWALRLESLDAVEPIAFPGWDDWDESGRALAAAATRA